ncbi:GDSL-like Lipase/Acylhydrolase family protein [Tsukamurella pulmonis]|uniref:GDSL-like Lipase/Acylhydrolase family protein n=2 Tax=Tsukamurella pulmonis TaxID=47312 RepID=A0A1H1HKL5_9ACTN|nr:GDSL-like Lipase/Acylhydrolase family protein [Tsukamurella pulmonis]SUP14204.1 Uncharacterised protein [Tsukamurella pulmonis]
MVAPRNSRHLRRWGLGIALGAGIACAPFAIAAASADPGTGAAQPGAAIPVAHAQSSAGAPTVVKRVAAPVVVKPAARGPVAAERVAAAPGTAVAQTPAPAARPAPAVRPAPATRPAAIHRAAAPVAAVRPGVRVAEARRAVAPKPAPRGGTRTDRRSVVVIGASVSSGKAVSAPAAYPRQVGAMSGRNVYVSARVGAGYADGSMGRLTRAADLPARNPSLVVLQAGTNDVGASPTVIAGQVRQVVGTVRRQAPNAKIAVVTVFPSIHRGTAAHATDTAIIDAARSVDPGVVVISPLDEGWTYRAASDGHPGAAAHERLAERIAGIG